MSVAQPTLSVGIAKLERLLGTALFHRTAKRVHITDAGSRLAAHARRIENEFNLAEAAVRGLRPARTLRLGVISSYPMRLLADCIKSAQRPANTEQLEIIPGNERELLQRLVRGQVDVALTIVRQDAAEELADNAMIVRRHCEVLPEISRHFTERGVRPFFSFRGTSDEQILALVQAGLGLTVMPACFAMQGVVRPSLSGFDLKRQLGFLYAGHAEHYQHAGSPLLDIIRDRVS